MPNVNLRLSVWVAAAVFAVGGVLLAAFSEQDFRASGAMLLFSFGPGALAVGLAMRQPWRAATIRGKGFGLGGVITAGLVFVFFVAGGAPEYLKAQFGWFIGFDDYGPRAIVSSPFGYVIVADDAESNAVVLLSDDGRDWRRVPHQQAFTRLDVGDVIWAGDQLVLAAHDDRRGPFVTLTSEDGVTWERDAPAPVDGKPYQLAQGPETTVAIGDSFSNDAVFWYQDEGGEWQAAEPRPVIDTNKDPVGVVQSLAGFVAALNQHGDALLFASADGREWTQRERFQGASFSSISAATTGQIVVVGSEGDAGNAAMWRSSDGVTWDTHPLGNLSPSIELVRVVATRDAVLIFGATEDGLVHTWELRSGEWLELESSAFGRALVRDAVVNGDMAVAVGVDRALEVIAIWYRNGHGDWIRVTGEESAFAVR